MALENIGLEKLPNVYFSKITLEDYNSKSFRVSIRANLFDQLIGSNFIWSTDHLFKNFMKVAIIESSSERMIRDISNGENPHPANIRSLESFDERTRIYIFGYGDLQVMEDEDDRHFHIKTSILKPIEATVSSLFAFSYIDHIELSKTFDIKLTGTLRSYMGPILSEHIMTEGQLQATTNCFKKPDGSIWSGPVHMGGEKWYSGSFRNAETVELTKLTVKNTKLTDSRSREYSNRGKTPMTDLAIFSDLYYAMNNQADLFGLFSINMKQFALAKTKFGKAIYGLSDKMFAEVIENISLNSIEVRRRQVKFTRQTNRLGTPYYAMQDIAPYHIVATLSDLVGHDISESKEIRTYEFTDTSKTEDDRGEFVYEVNISIVDKTQDLVEKVVSKLKENLNGVKDIVRRLNHVNNYNSKTNSLREGETIPAEMKLYIEQYYSYMAMMKDISADELAEITTAKHSLFKSDTYRKRHGLRFIGEYEKLYSSTVRRFGITPKDLREHKVIPSYGYPPNVIQMTKTFAERICFNNIKTSYDIMDVQDNKNMIKINREDFESRADREVSRFFDLTQAVSSEDLFLLDSQDADAIKDIGASKMSYMSPISFQYKGQRKSIEKMENINLDELTDKFLFSVRTRQEKSTSSQSKPRQEKSRTRKRNKNIKKPVVAKRPKMNRFKFNFKPVTVKINNLSEKQEDYRRSREYLGPNSEFVLIDTNLEESVQPTDMTQSLRRFKVSNEVVTKRTKKEFDLKERGNFYERFRASKNYSPERLRKLPLSIKALFNSRASAAKNNIHESDSDVLKEPDTKIASEMVFHANQKIEAFLGYDKTESGETILTKPMWGELTTEMLSTKKDILCRTIYVDSPDVGVKPSPEFKFPVQNNVFIIVGDNAQEAEQQILDEVIELEEVQYVIYAQSNVIMQPRG